MPVFLLTACCSCNQGPSGSPGSLVKRIEALERRQHELEVRLGRLSQAQADDDRASGVALDRGLPAPWSQPAQPVSIKNLAASGKASAPIVIVEYSDFQCPFCRHFSQDTLPLIEQKYIQSGRVRFIFSHLPLERIHPFAVGAATAAECARRQDKFWAMHDRLFQNRGTLTREALSQHAAELALRRPAFDACVEADGLTEVRRQMADAARAGVSSTPTFLIGKRDFADQIAALYRVRGAQPFQVFEQIIERLLH